MNIIMSGNENKTFAALKLIEQLYKDGMLPEHVYRNIICEHAGGDDLIRFEGFSETKIKKGTED